MNGAKLLNGNLRTIQMCEDVNDFMMYEFSSQLDCVQTIPKSASKLVVNNLIAGSQKAYKISGTQSTGPC